MGKLLTAEPVYEIIKQVIGFREFPLGTSGCGRRLESDADARTLELTVNSGHRWRLKRPQDLFSTGKVVSHQAQIGFDPDRSSRWELRHRKTQPEPIGPEAKSDRLLERASLTLERCGT